MADPQPSPAALAHYVRARLSRIGPSFADDEVVQEALTLHRDLWERLYEIDGVDAPERFRNPS